MFEPDLYDEPKKEEEGGENKMLNMVRLNISCRQLPDTDLMSKTDPFVKVFIREGQVQDWTYVG